MKPPLTTKTPRRITVQELQEALHELYYKQDAQRGIERTYIWLVEEVGELAKALKRKRKHEIEEEIADVLAWTLSLANLLDINAEESICKKYPEACKTTERK